MNSSTKKIVSVLLPVRHSSRFVCLSKWLAVALPLFFLPSAHAFLHPGGLHTDTDFLRMSNKVAQAAHPWVDSYNGMNSVWMANLNMPWNPQTQIIRGGTGNNYARSQDDALAIYYHALRWRITGNTNYAEEAIAGMNLWSAKMTNGVGGDSNWALGAGICGYEFAVAGEALRGYPNWSATSISNYCNFLKIFAAGNDNFLANHNGTCDSHYWANWDGCNVASLIACAVFCDDTNMFNRAVAYYKQGKGNGNITSAAWFIHTNGLAQWQESGRDQAHTMDGVAWIGVTAQVAWNQGVDLFAFDNNRLLRGIEYAAKYNLFGDVPYQSYSVCEGGNFNWGTLSLNAGGRGFLPPTWDLFYNHYVNIKGLAAPWTAQAASAMRPDGFYNNANSPDFVGYTTLTSLLDPIPAGAVPSGLTAKIFGTNVLLNWWGSAYATNYLVKRATTPGGPYTTLANISSSADRAFFDSAVIPLGGSGVYYYVVSAQDKFGDSPNSPEVKLGVNQLTTYYRFNETSGTAASESSGLSPGATLMNGASFTPSGKFGYGVSLNGSSQYVALTNGLITNLGDFTIAAWVYLNVQNAWSRLFDFGADTDRYMFLTPYNGSGMRFAISKFTGPGEQQISAPALTAGAWHHVAVTLKRNAGSGVGTIYVDGVGAGTNSAMTFTPDMIGSLVNATNNFIGRSAFSGDPYLNARVDDFRIYNGALSAVEISALYVLTAAAPSAPTNSSATAASANVINLSWSSVANATNYLVQRSTNSGGPYVVLASSVPSTNFTDTGLAGSTTYYYIIAAANAGGTSTNSPEASATTLTPPPVPTGLIATGLYGGQIALSWSARAGATSYTVKRSVLPGGPYVALVPSAPSTTFTNTALLLNATYYYVVSASSANGESANSTEASSVVPVPTLIWKGNISTNWDVNLTTNWLFAAAPSTYFMDGAVANFDDTATTANVNLTANVSPISITFSNSTLNYTVSSANGSAIGGATALTKLGSGTATLTGTNTFTGDILINGSGTLAIGGAGLLGGGNFSGNIGNYATFNYASTATQTLSGAISLSGTLLKSGSGTLTVSGPDTHTGPTMVRQGTLNLTGAAKTGSSGIYVVDNNAASTTNAIVNISTDVTAARLWLGDRAGSGQVGAAYQSGGNVSLTQSASVDDLRIGSVASGRGYYKLSGGALTVNEIGIGALNNDTIGIFDITGGTFTDTGYLTIGRGGATSSGLLNITGGSASAYRVDMDWAGSKGALSVINVGGGNSPASLATSTDTTTGVSLASGTVSGPIGYVNLLTNGTLTTSTVRAGQAPPTAQLNFNGGTLAANTSAGNFLTDGNLDGVFVFSKGGTIDNGGKAITVDCALQSPTGLGVSSISGPSLQGSGYVGAPLVTFSGGTGSGAGGDATAYAVMADDGTGRGTFKVTGIVVTSPGIYSLLPTTVTLGGGGATVAASGFGISPIANTSGGMTFAGSGTTTLSGTNNYSGATVIAGGTVVQGGPLLHLSFDATNGTSVLNDGSSGASMNGTLNGTAAVVAGGHSGNALQVTGTAKNAGYVFVNGSGPLMSVASGAAWTVAYWLKTSTPGAICLYQGTGGWGSTGGTSDTLMYCGSGNPEVLASSTRIGIVSFGHNWELGTANITDGNWHFVTMTCNGTTKINYVDGVLDALAQTTLSGAARGNQIWIGGCPTAIGDAVTNLNGGLIDDVYIYSRALGLAEVTNLMNGVMVASPALPAGNDLAVAGGASLVLSGSAQSVGLLSGGNSGTIQLGAGSTPTALTLGKNNFNSIFAGSISGSGSVTKTGSGSITLSGVNAYNGATVINTGVVKFGQSDNTNYVATLGPLLKLTFDQTNGGDIFIDDNGNTITNPIVALNAGLGGAAMDGTLSGAGAVVVGGGRYGNALSLDGTASVFINNKITALDCNTNGAGWTYALWVKTSTAGATYGYQGDGSWSGAMTTFYLNNNATTGGTKAGGVRYGDGWLTGTTALNNNAWHFLAIAVSNGVETIYVDGNLDAQTGTTGWAAAASSAANQFWIGQTPATTDGEVPFNGLIDEVQMFNRALTLAEVRNIMSNQTVIATGVVTGKLPTTTPVSIASAGALDLSGTAQTIASLADLGGGVVTNSAGTTATLTFGGSTTNTFAGKISDASAANAISLVKLGSGTQSLNGANNFHGNVTVSNGTLSFAQATLPTNGTVSLASGAVLNLNFTGTNRIGALALNSISQPPGIFSAANSSPFITGAGSLVIAAPVATNPPAMTFTNLGGSLVLAWPADHTGWRLQVQTNNLTAGLGTNWSDVPGATATNSMNFLFDASNGSVFYRLVYP